MGKRAHEETPARLERDDDTETLNRVEARRPESARRLVLALRAATGSRGRMISSSSAPEYERIPAPRSIFRRAARTCLAMAWIRRAVLRVQVVSSD